MSRENVERTRRLYERWRQTRSVPTELVDPEIVWQTPTDIPESTTLKGTEAINRHLSGYDESFDQFTVDVEEMIEVGNWVVAAIRLSGRIKGTDDSLDLLGAQLWEFNALGLVTRVREFRSVPQALEAAGLSE